MKYRYAFLVLLLFSFVGCDRSDEFSEFEKHLLNDDYKFAMKIYKDNSKSRSFKKKVDKYWDEYISGIPNITLNNYIDISYDIEILSHLTKKEPSKGLMEQLTNVKKEDIKLKGEKLDKYIKGEVATANEQLKKVKDEKKKQDELEKSLKEKAGGGESKEDKTDTANEEKDIENIKYISKKNEKGNYSFKYPSFLTSTGLTLNEFGEFFKNEDGSIELKCEARKFEGVYSIDDLYRDMLEGHKNITYKYKGKDSVVVSWDEGSNIFYAYNKIDNGMVKGFIATYNNKYSKVMDEVIPVIYENFK